MRTHLVIPDLQVKPGVALDHLKWIGRYIIDRKPDVIIDIGDHADMCSLSSYDKGKKSFEGRRVKEDFKAVHKSNELLWAPLFNDKHYNKCETHITLGNHENRINRAIENSAEFDGLFGTQDLLYEDWYDHVHPFLEPVVLDGVSYAHYFYNPMSGRPWGGNADCKLKNIGFSFTMGHQQGKHIAVRSLANGQIHNGLISGSCYLHDEHYIGPQAQNHWKGIIVKHEVRDGDYDIMIVSLSYLCKKYEKMEIKAFLKKKYGRIDGYVD